MLNRPKNKAQLQRVVFFLLTLFLVAQVSWWVYFQVRASEKNAALQRELWKRQLTTAQIWMGAHNTEPGAKERWLHEAFPDLALTEDGILMVDPQAEAKLTRETEKVSRMFMYEAVTFTIILTAGFFFMYWTLQREITFERRQSSFLSAISHELKTPITAIRLYSETLQHRDLPKEQSDEILSNLDQNLDRLQSLIERLLQARAMLGAKQVGNIEVVHLAEETTEAVRTVQESIGELFKVDISTELDDTLRIRIDPEHWRIIVTNLVENAVKYSIEGSEVQIRLTRSGRRARLKVIDNGMGFPKNEQRRIFDRFYRAEKEDTRRTTGSGLGLYLVREISRIYGGRVKSYSAGPGRGAEFTVCVPLA